MISSSRCSRLSLAACVMFLVGGCASVEFLDEPGSEAKDVGFTYYPPRPFLLISETDGVLSASIVSLPDVSSPRRVRHKGGWGSAEMSFEVTNGMISSFNSKTDSKSAETLAAIATLGTASAAITTAEAAMITAQDADDNKINLLQRSTDLGERSVTYSIERMNKAIEALDAAIEQFGYAPDQFGRAPVQVGTVRAALEAASTFETNPLDPAGFLEKLDNARQVSRASAIQLQLIASSVEEFLEQSRSTTNLHTPGRIAIARINDAIEELRTFFSGPPSPTGLYEIDFDSNGQLKLEKVIF